MASAFVAPLAWNGTRAALGQEPGDAVDLWPLELENGCPIERASWSNCLAEEEEEQARRYLRPATGLQFRHTRAALRHILADYLRLPPREVPLIRLPMGKPALPPDQGLAPLTFNVSHTANHALIAISFRREVGVDVETRQRTLDCVGMAERFFAPEEAEELKTVDANRQLEAFLRFWTRKEALLKGQGRGLSQDWTDVAVGPLRHPFVTVASSDRQTLWQVHDLTLPTPHVAAVAVEGLLPFTLRWRSVADLL